MKYLPLLALLAASPAAASTWTMQPASTLSFTGTETGASFTGHFSAWTAAISYDPTKPQAAKVHIVINTGSAASGDTQRDEAMPDPDWFSSVAFPQAVFDATGFTPLGGDKFSTTGTLSIRGVAKKVTLPFTLDVAGGTATATGALNLTRTDFGVGQGQWASGDYVGLGVTVNFTVVVAAK